MLTTNDLIASRHLVAGPSPHSADAAFERAITEVAAAGFAGINIGTDDYLAIRAAGMSDDAIETTLSSRGLVLGEIQCPLWMSGERPDATALRRLKTVFHIAERFGPVHHAVFGLGARGEAMPDAQAVAARLHGICCRSAELGMVVALEYFPWGQVPDAAAAWSIVELVDHPACGVTIDFWHHHTGAGSPAMLQALPRGRVHAVHITDGIPDVSETNPWIRTQTQRCLPGDGAFPMLETVRLLDELGTQASYTVEVGWLRRRGLTTAEFARAAYDATRRTLAMARGSGVRS